MKKTGLSLFVQISSLIGTVRAQNSFSNGVFCCENRIIIFFSYSQLMLAFFAQQPYRVSFNYQAIKPVEQKDASFESKFTYNSNQIECQLALKDVVLLSSMTLAIESFALIDNYTAVRGSNEKSFFL